MLVIIILRFVLLLILVLETHTLKHLAQISQDLFCTARLVVETYLVIENFFLAIIQVALNCKFENITQIYHIL